MAKTAAAAVAEMSAKMEEVFALGIACFACICCLRLDGRSDYSDVPRSAAHARAWHACGLLNVKICWRVAMERKERRTTDGLSLFLLDRLLASESCSVLVGLLPLQEPLHLKQKPRRLPDRGHCAVVWLNMPFVFFRSRISPSLRSCVRKEVGACPSLFTTAAAAGWSFTTQWRPPSREQDVQKSGPRKTKSRRQQSRGKEEGEGDVEGRRELQLQGGWGGWPTGNGKK